MSTTTIIALSEIKLSIPCMSCGCDKIVGVTKKTNTPVKIEICACDDGSGYFNATIISNYADPDKIDYLPLVYKSKEELESILNAGFYAFKIDHHCSPVIVVPQGC